MPSLYDTPLQSMDHIMGKTARLGLPTSENATSIVQTGSEYIIAGQRAVDGLTQLIDRRKQKLSQLQDAAGSPHDVAFERNQIELLSALRTRIQQSIERIREIMLERPAHEPDPRSARRHRTQAIERSLSDLQAQLLIPQSPSISSVHQTYRSG